MLKGNVRVEYSARDNGYYAYDEEGFVCGTQGCNKEKLEELVECANKERSQKDVKWICTKDRLPLRNDGDKYGRVLALRLGLAIIIKFDEVIPENASHWMALPKEPAE